MKVTLTNLKVNFLQTFTLKKQISNRFIAESIENELIYDDKDDFDYLLESAVKGDDKETGTIETQCEQETYTKDVFLKHNDGRFNLRGCIANKQVQLTNILDCVLNETLNIFDYEPSPTKTIQGILDQTYYANEVLRYIGNADEVVITLEMLIGIVGTYPDKTAEGFYPEYVQLNATPQYETYIDPQGQYERYTGHKVTISVRYIRLRDYNQNSDEWTQIPGQNNQWYYRNVISIGGYILKHYNTWAINDIVQAYYEEIGYEAGRAAVFIDRTISNTYLINPILTELFECIEKPLVSNFLNINPDQTQPANSVYEFADKYCKQLKIAQSYDIIREKALQDSFGESGKIKTKDLLGNIFGMFNLNLVFDKEADVLRLEHISYFTTKGIDLTAKNYEIGDVAINSQQIDVETFSFAQPTPTEGFYSVKIEYERKDLYSDQNEINYQANRILTDVFGCINNPDFDRDEYKPLFFIMATADNSIIGLNSMLAMRVIMPRLHSMMRPSKTGKIGSEHITFDSYSIGMETEVKMLGSIKMWDKINPYYSVKTNQGSFLITEVTFDDKGELKMKVIK